MPRHIWLYRASSKVLTRVPGDSWRGEPTQNRWKRIRAIPPRTSESNAMSKDLKRHGFQLAGSTICHAHMKAVRLVSGHLVECLRQAEFRSNKARKRQRPERSESFLVQSLT